MLNNTIVKQADAAFQTGIIMGRNSASYIQSGCQMIKMAGGTQSECSAIFTESYRALYPSYNFSKPSQNPEEQRREYDRIRKNISNFWLGPVSQRKPTQVPASAPAPVAQQVAPSVLRIADPAPSNDSAPLPAAMNAQVLEELVLNMAKNDPAWAQQLTEKLLNLF